MQFFSNHQENWRKNIGGSKLSIYQNKSAISNQLLFSQNVTPFKSKWICLWTHFSISEIWRWSYVWEVSWWSCSLSSSSLSTSPSIITLEAETAAATAIKPSNTRTEMSRQTLDLILRHHYCVICLNPWKNTQTWFNPLFDRLIN